MTTISIPNHPIATREDWLIARLALLEEEKQLTRTRDALAARRRALPWVQMTKPYVFEGPDGPLTLIDLFEGRSQLIVQHFMLGPGWKEGCVGCSFLADHADGANLHLQHHDVSLVAVSRATWPEIERFKTRMQWNFPWVSSFGSNFNFDFHVSFTPEQIAAGQAYNNFEFNDPGIEEIGGHSVFIKTDNDRIFHTYSAYARGDEPLINTYNYLDLTPLGRNETGPRHDLTDWVRHHDCYDQGGHVDKTGRYHERTACGCNEA